VEAVCRTGALARPAVAKVIDEFRAEVDSLTAS